MLMEILYHAQTVPQTLFFVMLAGKIFNKTIPGKEMSYIYLWLYIPTENIHVTILIFPASPTKTCINFNQLENEAHARDTG